MKLDSDSTPAMTKVAVVSTISRSREPVAVDLGFGKMGDEVVGRAGPARGHFGGEKVAQLLEGGDVLGIAAFDRFVGRDREDDLAPDVGVVALRQAHGAEQQPDRDLAGEVVDELEASGFADTVERAVGDFDGGRDQMLDVLAHEGGLAQRPQAVVARRIGRPQASRRRGREARRSCCLATTRRSPSRAPPARCRRSATGSRACRSRSSSRDIARAGSRSTGTDRHRFPASRDRMLPSLGRVFPAYFGCRGGYHDSSTRPGR